MTADEHTPRPEARAAPRFPLNLPVAFRGGMGRTRDISAAGVYFTSERSIKVGSRMSLTITLQGDDGDAPVVLHCRGPVVRVSESGDNLGVAVQFDDMQIEG